MQSAERELAVADAAGKAFGIAGGGILAIGRDELGERGEQAGLRQAIAVDAIEASFGPGLGQIAESRPLFFRMIRSRRDRRTRTRPGTHDRPHSASRHTFMLTLARANAERSRHLCARLIRITRGDVARDPRAFV